MTEPYRTALREAVAYIFARYTPLGIVATGSVVRGQARPNSDIDLLVVNARPVRQWINKRFHGVPVELFVNPADRLERAFETDKFDESGRLYHAHMMANGTVVYAADDTVARLQARAAAVLASPPAPSPVYFVQLQYNIANCLDDALDLVDEDPEHCFALLVRVVDRAVEYRFWVARQWQPRAKDALRTLGALDEPLAAQVRAFYRAPHLHERVRLAREVVQRSTGVTGFFEFETPAQEV